MPFIRNVPANRLCGDLSHVRVNFGICFTFINTHGAVQCIQFYYRNKRIIVVVIKKDFQEMQATDGGIL